MDALDILDVKNWFESKFKVRGSLLTITFDEQYIGKTWIVSNNSEIYVGRVDSSLTANVILNELSTTYDIICGNFKSTIATKEYHSNIYITIT